MHHHILHSIFQIKRCFDSYRKQNIKDLDIYPGLQSLAGHICRHPGSIQEEIVDRMCIDKTTVAHHLQKLEEKGYIERKISEEDGRCRKVYPTEKALAIEPVLEETYDTFYETIIRGMTEEEQQVIEKLITRMAENAKTMISQKK